MAQVRWNRLDKIAAVAALCVVVYYIGLNVMPKIDGMLNPVVVDGRMVSFELKPPPQWRGVWQAAATKRRDCEYIYRSIKWYVGTPNGPRQQVYALFEDAPKIRGKGHLTWDNLVIDLEPNIVLTNSYATVKHRCPWVWWDVESRFYTSS